MFETIFKIFLWKLELAIIDKKTPNGNEVKVDNYLFFRLLLIVNHTLDNCYFAALVKHTIIDNVPLAIR
jgi:hypothetical protein